MRRLPIRFASTMVGIMLGGVVGFSLSAVLVFMGLIAGRGFAVEDDRLKSWAEPFSGIFVVGMLAVLIVGTTVPAALGGWIVWRSGEPTEPGSS